MALRCLLFTSDEGTAEPILQVLAGLGVEGEHCSEAVTTVEKVTQQSFQIVIIDWDQQPEAALLLAAARERKAAERPITLAIVSNDVSVPQALQAGANSILRKPIMAGQVKDTLTTAHDLLRSKQESAAYAAAAGASSFGGPASLAASAAATLPASMAPPKDRTLRAGEFLHSSGSAPGGQFVTGSEVHESLAPPSVGPVDTLHDLEPMAASMAEATEEKAEASPEAPPQPGETKGLEWFLRTRAVKAPPAPAPAPAPAAPTKPELLGYDNAASYSPPLKHSEDSRRLAPEPKSNSISVAQPRRAPDHEPKYEPRRQKADEQKREAELFAYISGEKGEPEETSRPPFRFKGAIIGALVLATCAIVAAPQAPWHPKIGAAWAHGRQTMHTWLNPQLVTTPQAPVAHEDFGRAGDEYKLPVAENIPDATTDPSQIRVLPVIDPTIKKSNPEGGNALQPSADGDGTGPTPVDQTPAPGNPDSQISAATPEASQPTSPPAASAVSASPAISGGSAATVPAVVAPPHSDPFTPVPGSSSPGSSSASVSPVPARPTQPRDPSPHSAPAQGSVPSSLKSQMASTTPDAGGNKAVESAMASIEPVTVPEFTERALLTEQPALAYPASAKGQQGTVVLQVLIGRDGTVQDAKFLQGSLAFAKSAIDGVKLWKFKPYAMNGRPVSVLTLMTMSFKPTS